MTQAETSERKWIWLFCCLAAIHVFIFSAAFPFFSSVDEQFHFDLVVRYSQGHIPAKLEPVCAEARPFIMVFGTSEYFWPADYFPNKQFPQPLWTQSFKKAAPALAASEKFWKTADNDEVSQPPLYYTLAGLWWHVGKWCGFDGGRLLYWIRFLNILFVAVLVWLGYFTARLIFPENPFLRLGVPMLLAFIPQAAFYSILNDAFSPLSFGVAFILLIKLWQAEIPSVRLGAITGLALAATFLTKISNLPLLAVSGVFIAMKIWRLFKENKMRAAAPAIFLLAICALLPTAGWLAWCKINFGDFAGSEEKIQILGWTYKPLAEWWHHPIFTPQGFWIFIHDLLSTFWQGEILWHRQSLSLSSVDLIYVISTIIFIGIAALNLLPKLQSTTKPQRETLWFGFGCFIAVVAFSGFLSIIYDFHDCFYPSRDHPYFTSGRLMLGALIPFLLLFVYGIDRALSRIKNNWIRPFILIAIILFMLISEIATDWPVFSSEYNWFHL